jgi:hypothetical protein
MSYDYGFISEVWSDPNQKQKVIVSDCQLKTRKLDSIMDAYMEDKKCQSEQQVQPSNQNHDQSYLRGSYSMENVEGYNLSQPFYVNAYNLLPIDPVKPSFQNTISQEHVVQSEHTSVNEEVQPIVAYVEKFDNPLNPTKNQQTLENNYIELAIYILSGIFIIFMMEQILQIGRRIK